MTRKEALAVATTAGEMLRVFRTQDVDALEELLCAAADVLAGDARLPALSAHHDIERVLGWVDAVGHPADCAVCAASAVAWAANPQPD